MSGWFALRALYAWRNALQIHVQITPREEVHQATHVDIDTSYMSRVARSGWRQWVWYRRGIVALTSSLGVGWEPFLS